MACSWLTESRGMLLRAQAAAAAAQGPFFLGWTAEQRYRGDQAASSQTESGGIKNVLLPVTVFEIKYVIKTRGERNKSSLKCDFSCHDPFCNLIM